jgi:hypothetical protein
MITGKVGACTTPEEHTGATTMITAEGVITSLDGPSRS